MILTADEETEPELIEQAVEIMRTRIAAFGEVQEPEISISGENSVLVQLPGLTDQEKALEAVGTTGLLTFRPVINSSLQLGYSPALTYAENPDDPDNPLVSAPSGVDKLTGLSINDDPSTTSYLLSLSDGFPIIYELGPAGLTGNDIDDALAVFPNNEWIVQLNFKDESADKFTNLTKELASKTGDQRKLAIVLDEQVISAPSIAFDNSTSTGIFRSSANVIGISNSGTEKYRFSADIFDAPAIQVDGTLGNTAPFFKVDPAVNKVLIGPATNFLSLDNTNTIKSEGTNVAVPLNFETKGSGNFVFKGGTDKTFSITDGTSDVVTVDTATGTALFGGNLDAGKLRIRQNVVQNNSSTATRAFGEITALTVTGTGSGYTDGTYTATATTSNNSGTGCTVTLTVASGTFLSLIHI